jgi:hypothetical protein
METRRSWVRHGVCGLLLAASASAYASRHGVEEAEILPRGECELELALARAHGRENQYLSELSCRVGPVQLNGELEHERPRDDGSQTATAAEVKWAREMADGWSAGVLLRAQFAAHQHPHHDATALVGLLSYQPRPELALHLNLGRDFLRGGGHLLRSGIGAEWKLRPEWSLLAERYAQDGTHFFRGTVRWAAGHNWTLEFGRAQRLAGPDPSRWTIQVNIDLDDD